MGGACPSQFNSDFLFLWFWFYYCRLLFFLIAMKWIYYYKKKSNTQDYRLCILCSNIAIWIWLNCTLHLLHILVFDTDFKFQSIYLNNFQSLYFHLHKQTHACIYSLFLRVFFSPLNIFQNQIKFITESRVGTISVKTTPTLRIWFTCFHVDHHQTLELAFFFNIKTRSRSRFL